MNWPSERIRSAVLNGTLRRKLILAFVGVAVMVALVGAVGLLSVSGVSATADTIANDGVETVDGAMMLKLESQRERAALLALLEGDREARSEFQNASEKFDRVLESRLASRDGLPTEQRQLLEEVKDTHDETVAIAGDVIRARSTGDKEAVRENLEKYENKQQELENLLGRVERNAKDRLQGQVAAANETQWIATGLILLLTVGSLVGALLLGRRFGRDIASGIEDARDAAERIANGQFDFEIEETDRRDEVGDLNRSFASMTAHLSTVSGQARAVADQEFDAAVLDEEVPGTLGDAMSTMATDIERAQREAAEAKERVEALNEALERKAIDYRETMERAADGDLTQRMDPDSENQAMEEVGEAFNGMMDDLESTIAGILAFTDEVVASSESVRTSTDEIQSASGEVSRSVQEIADNAEKQYENLQQVNGELQGLSGSIEEIASSADEVARTTQRATDRGQSGREEAEAAIEEMEAIRETADGTVAEVESLAEEIKEIGEIVEFITEIAEQTNMLALNASIEAARAGEAGEGFAVVADEIKGLAAEVSDATDDIETLIEDVQGSSSTAVADMRSLGDRVDSGSETIEAALDDLDEIVAMVEDANRGIQEISEATDDQAASTEETVSMVDEVASFADDARTEAESASAATEEQTAALGDVADQVERLATDTDDLRDSLDGFTVGAGATARTDDGLGAVSDTHQENTADD